MVERGCAYAANALGPGTMTVSYAVVGPDPEGICRMKASHNLAAVTMTFDEDNLVPHAGLIGPVLLAQRPGVAELVGHRVRLAPKAGAANSDAKALTFLAGYGFDPGAGAPTLGRDGPSRLVPPQHSQNA